MKILFKYNEDKDIDCLMSKGPGSFNQPGSKTTTYMALENFTSDVGDRDKVREFIKKYLLENKINPENLISLMESDWNKVDVEFQIRAEKVFQVRIPDTITAFLTVAGRHSYSTKENFFYVPASLTNIRGFIMHELWHFYTWHRFGKEELSKLGLAKYNDIKEALTVILNQECADIMNSVDYGYAQHQNLRKLFIDTWLNTKDIDDVWSAGCNAV